MLILDELNERDVQSRELISGTLGGSSGISVRFWHCPNQRFLRLVSALTLVGMLRKLFLLGLQLLWFKFVKELKHGKEGKCKPIPFEPLPCNNQNEKSELNELDGNILHPG